MISAESDTSQNFTIVLSQLTIGLFFAHRLLVVFDSNKEFVAELDGLVVNKDGKFKPIGYLPSDRLKVFEFKYPCLYKEDQEQVVLCSSSEECVMSRWNAAVHTKEILNEKNMPYPFLGIGKNSNSVASTLIRCMGLKELAIPNAKIAPYQGIILLDDRKINEIQNNWIRCY
ncbi:hypothetical protein Q7M76_01570 [Candidatus Liberibacter asiaticus]|uniref:Uncharacterized protein n=2 Tax=Liberibacter asiaticus TaxID=34021 RepID=C6XEW7_LIBAP|nr:hypothetical protein [Candidatus Liberibacter asiaticus]ACT56919.1 hypothetical protein CLIBASIA_01655 [Candidatus Liberibacter asiaticus str. psy62]AGH16683.1 hypothetical protein WSI_01565 [Candidatus Liberibacter asiaticus str. gxpsy]ALK07063.1 hypothetical protein CD16_01575 [Candidatus Liberibacter asiaticus]ASK52535.1 hypothetical protein B2I23_01600 [Candidatus Liberibacter asiaticus]AWL13859.1 hypothetical protein DIC79_01625 [Candidatus Liberibacter asiaticus]